MNRTIFIGDIHGCLDEVRDLLGLLEVSREDRVVSLGDITRKGPAVGDCVDLWRERGYEAVLGNNDAKLIARSKSWKPAWLAAAPDRQVLLKRKRLDVIRSWPLFLDCQEAGAVAVHGGVLPNSERFSAALAPRRAALELRYIRKNGQWTQIPKGQQLADDPFWADVWNGDRIVVYGHTPRQDVLIHPRAIGLDTGCVYGGKLSAAVFTAKDKYEIVSVPARRAYAD